MEFFSGFRWAVPTAFAEAVSFCRFEDGDILYDTREAYDGEWGDARKSIAHSIQVLYPPHAATTSVETQGDTQDISEKAPEQTREVNRDGVFTRNWRSNVKLALYTHSEGMRPREVDTTQGRLYTALWRGDLSILNSNTKAPPLPMRLRDVTRKLKETRSTAKQLSPADPVFVMARDLSSTLSGTKYLKVAAKMRDCGGKPQALDPEAAGLVDFARVAPTTQIIFFTTQGVEVEVLHLLLKEALYVPAKDAARDMFRLSAHGQIF